MVGEFFFNVMINMTYYDNLTVMEPECERTLTVASA